VAVAVAREQQTKRERLEFKDYCRQTKYVCQIRSLTLNALGVDLSKPKLFPALQSWAFNAVSVKAFLVFLAIKLGNMDNSTEYARVRHTCLWAAAEIVYITDHSGIRLEEWARSRLRYAGALHVLSFAKLFQMTEHRHLFHPVPKWHYFEHVIDRAVLWGINPQVWSVWDDEKYLSRVKSLGKACHGGTMLQRSLQRYILMLALRWDRRRRAEERLCVRAIRVSHFEWTHSVIAASAAGGEVAKGIRCQISSKNFVDWIFGDQAVHRTQTNKESRLYASGRLP
jgi:hypothetical protein